MQHPEPFEGYNDLTADQVVERLKDLSPDDLARVKAYERQNKKRKTILAFGEVDHEPFAPEGRPSLAQVAEEAAARDDENAINLDEEGDR